jgi:hypothetical protein
MERYICKECGAEAIVTKDKTVRSCTHTGTIILDMEVVATGHGGFDA